jgi:hypothetical protein
MRDRARHRRLVVVGIEPRAAVGDAAVALDMRRLDDDEAGAAVRQHAEMAMCQSVALPSSALYWHIGETTRRFENSTPAMRMGENRELVMEPCMLEGGAADHRKP